MEKKKENNPNFKKSGAKTDNILKQRIAEKNEAIEKGTLIKK